MKKISILISLLLLLPLTQNGFSVTRIYDRVTGGTIDADKDDAEFDNTNTEINNHEADTSAHGATGGVVGVSKTQTLTNKTLTGPTISSLVVSTSATAAGVTWTDLGTVTTADINGGTIDGVTIGASVAPTFTTVNIDGGTIDGTTIGGSSTAAGSFTSVTASANSIVPQLVSEQTINLGLKVSGTTLSIVSGDGTTSLSTTNPGWASVKINGSGVKTFSFTADQTATFGAASDTDGNTFGLTSGVNWSSRMPFFLGIITDGTNAYFTISRKPFQESGSNATDLAQEGDTDADSDNDLMIFTTGLTLANWVDKPVTQVGWFLATWVTATTSWSFETSTAVLTQGNTGFNKDYAKNFFTMPLNQNGAAASTYFHDNGGTAPVFTSTAYYWWIDEDGFVTVDQASTGDGGTDGAGVVTATCALPLTTSAFASDIGFIEIQSAGYNGSASVVLAATSNIVSFRKLSSTNLANSEMSAGSRQLNFYFTYPTLP